MQINTYLNFPGNCEEALHFYEQALGAKILNIMHVKGSPMEANMPPEMANGVLHAAIALGGQTLLASDMAPGKAVGEKMFAITISDPSPDELARLFALLAEGGQVTMPLQETFWAKAFGMLTDRFGIPWMFNCEQAA